MRIINIGVGEMNTSDQAEEILKTYALGSCVGVIALAPRQRAVGLLHVALPDAAMNPEMAAKRPCMFVDSGILCLLKEMARYGCGPADLMIKLAGGANILDDKEHFAIGKRNILAVKKTLWRYRLGAVAEDVGQDFSRTVTIRVDTGIVMLSSPGRGEWEL